MHTKIELKQEKIRDYIGIYYRANDAYPSVRDISEGTKIPVATVQRYLTSMRQSGDVEYAGRRSASTPDIRQTCKNNYCCVRGYVACGPGQEEEEQFLEYIRMPESLVGKGECFALIAKGESMIDAGIFPGDYVIVRPDKEPKEGKLIIALFDGKNNLKKLHLDDENQKYVLQSCNPDKMAYADIIVDELEMQGVVIGVYHKFE